MGIDLKPESVILRSGTFAVDLVPAEKWDYRRVESLACHGEVLLPLLKESTECWAYGVPRGTKEFTAIESIATPSRGRDRIATGGDAVTGREAFWNARTGRRGTVVVIIPTDRFAPERVFSRCYGAHAVTNFLSGHTPAAVAYARRRVSRGQFVAFCLPRNNGIEYASVFAPPQIALELFRIAVPLVRASED